MESKTISLKYPRVSIIILNWNGLEDTIECLESLKKISYPNFDVIIVDNASSGDDVIRLKERYTDYISIIANDRNWGFPEGCNIGMRYALAKGADYFLLLNNDIVVDPEFLTALIEVGESDPSIGILASKIYYYNYPNRIQAAGGGKMIWWLGDMKVYGEAEDIGQYDEVAERDFLYGTSFLIKKAVTDKISLMDPRYFFGPEEHDYCIRARRAGFKVMYVPKSKVWHKEGASRAKLGQYPETQKLIKKTSGFGHWKHYYRFFRTYYPPILFIFPFLNQAIFRISTIRVLFELMWRGDWEIIKRGAAKRLRSRLR